MNQLAILSLLTSLYLASANALFADDRAPIDDATAAPNVIVRFDWPDNLRQGAFEEFDGYLANAGDSLRSLGPATDRFTFVRQLPKAGWYRVFLWWPHAPSSRQTPVRVIHSKGATTLQVDQTALAGQWVPLGIYSFGLDTPARVELVGHGERGALIDSARFQYVGNAPPVPRIITTGLPVAEVGQAYDMPLQAEGGEPPYRWRAISTLPAGITLAGDGRLAGAPLRSGSFLLTLEISDAVGATHRRALTLDVVKPSRPSPEAKVRDPARKAKAPGAVLIAAAGMVPIGTLGGSLAGAADVSDLISVLESMPEGSWARVNLNKYSDVWAPKDLRPLFGYSNPTPEKILLAWSGMAWDTNRASLWIHGGGHANYNGNEVYRWSASTRLWERASLPSEVKQDNLGNWIAIDGPHGAPIPAHPYDNLIFLPKHDRLLVVGGAAPSGGAYRTQLTASTSRNTGPYVFDPNRAHPNKVGGTQGSHVKRVGLFSEVLGGEMWSNRDHKITMPTSNAGNASHVNGCTAYAVEGGKDVVYVATRMGFSTGQEVYRYVIEDLDEPERDSWVRVGRYWLADSGQTACAYDPVTKTFLRQSKSIATPFTFWNLSAPSTTNYDRPVPLQDPSGVFVPLIGSGAILTRYCGLDFDPVRRKFVLWCGDGRVWTIDPPDAPTPWRIRQATGLQTGSGLPQASLVGNGILGKWAYAPNLDAFVGVQHNVEGNVWMYKPIGWKSPDSGTTGGSSSETVVLQEGNDGYTGTQDVYLASSHPTSNFGASTNLYSQTGGYSYSGLVRFKIFQSEGGPVPNDATIISARLGLYKYSFYNFTYSVNQMLTPWDERASSWTYRLSGVPWGSPGANRGGIDFRATPDSTATINWAPGWLQFDVTDAVKGFRAGTPNYGWKLVPGSGNINIKRFYSRESTVNTGLRPKLTINYSD